MSGSQHPWIALFVFVAITFTAAWMGTQWTITAIPGWYARLRKPPWNPPNRVFGPVWSVLYLLMAIAVWLVWCQGGLVANAVPLFLFSVQLILNVLWSYLFFGKHCPGPAFGEIVALWLAILATMVSFWQRVPLAGWLFVPYLSWVSFASALNFAIWQLNP